MALQLTDESIVSLEVDAVVNAANAGLACGGGVCGAIFDAAGYEFLTEECRKFPKKNGERCPVGESRITFAGNMKCKYVVHTVGPIYDSYEQDEAEKLLASAYRSAIQVAIDNEVSSIAFPCISTGIYGFPLERAAEIAIEESVSAIQAHRELTIIFCMFNERERSTYERVMKNMFGEN